MPFLRLPCALGTLVDPGYSYVLTGHGYYRKQGGRDPLPALQKL
jgi:hypothetical protein